MNTLITLLSLLIVLPSWAGEVHWNSKSPSTTENVLEIATVGLLVADWMAVKWLVKNPERGHEHNFILGEHPKSRDVDKYFPAAIGVQVLGYLLLPDNLRKYWLGAWLTVEVLSVSNCIIAGAGFSF